MREIKFRAWIAELNRFSDSCCVYSDGSWDATVNIPSGESVSGYGNEEKGSRLSQFTGLKDKDGVEIYEGDIVYIAGHGNHTAEFPFIDLYEAAAENDIGEILGNIYETPELAG